MLRFTEPRSDCDCVHSTWVFKVVSPARLA